MTKPHIYIAAAEKSGDELGAKLVRSLRKQTGGAIQFSGIGGSALAAQGVRSAIDISPLSIVGYLEGFKSYPIIMERVRQCIESIMDSGADAVVLIDSWGFMVRIAKGLKKLGYTGTIIKYVAPQVWATREGRSKILARHVDHLLTIHSFDAPYFTRHGLDVIYVGNPVFDEDYGRGDGAGLRDMYKISQDAPVLTVLFGSRLSEVQKLARPFSDAIAILKSKLPDLAIFSPISDNVAEDVMAAAATDPRLQDVIFLGESQKLDCFAAADAALACSGTVTTQLASAGIPSAVGYKLDGPTHFIASRLYKPDYISIVNIAAQKELMPEFVQGECSGENLARALLPYLRDPEARADASKLLRAAVNAMRAGDTGGAGAPSSERAAKAVLKILRR